ncbi:MAG: serine/threonine-protein phosphatase [Treponema sp.]|nr:serine/threonine-protein phosphatase [Treponema sp.]
MVFFTLNIISLIAFAVVTFYIDRKVQLYSRETNALIVPMLLLSVEAAIFVIVLFIRGTWLNGLTNGLLHGVFIIDCVFWVFFSFNMVSVAVDVKKTILNLIKYALILVGVLLVVKTFQNIDISDEYLLSIPSEKVFSAPVNYVFKWSWVDIYVYSFQYALPIIAYLFYMLFNEKSGNSLQKYQGVLMGEALLMFWAITAFKNFMTASNVGFSSLFLYPYLFMMLMSLSALSKKSVPSGRSIATSMLTGFMAYILPATAAAFGTAYLQPEGNFLQPGYIVLFVLIALVTIFISVKGFQLMVSSSRFYTTEYGPAFERDLGKINYSAEMDEITAQMYSIFKTNVQTSSLSVYIPDGKGNLEIAYSSNNSSNKVALNNPMFDTLLNINKSVVCYTEVGHVHDISEAETYLDAFFKETDTDAFFILNEGRNILGLITLGRKISGDHYKEYDIEIFNKLYSYFFVFGYYMRNISNKEIISVVNREIKMSSQIITSIQENIDHIKDPKVDIGYLMVPAHNIGGEFIDLIRLTDKRHLFVVGDLSGKGIAASMNMVILKSIIRTYLAETHDFKELVVKINRFIRDSLRKGTIFSGLFALVDFETDTMYYINCGIPALMLYTQVYNNVIEIQGSGHILGFVKDISPYISVKTTKLNRGDIILACTDGLVQSHSLRGEQFGKERIQQALLDNSTYPAQRMVQFTFDGLTKFMSKEMEDDVSILVMKYETAAQFVDEAEKEAEEMKAKAESAAIEEAAVENTPAENESAEVVEESVAEAPVESSDVAEVEMPAEPEIPSIPETDDFAAIAAAAMAEAGLGEAELSENPFATEEIESPVTAVADADLETAIAETIENNEIMAEFDKKINEAAADSVDEIADDDFSAEDIEFGNFDDMFKN